MKHLKNSYGEGDSGSFGCLVILVVLGYLSYWLWININPFMRPADSAILEATKKAQERMHIALWDKFNEGGRLEVFQDHSVRAYISNGSYMSVAYPDREAAVARVGEAWCESPDVEHIWMPKVVIRDIQTGNDLDVYRCVFHFKSDQPTTNKSLPVGMVKIPGGEFSAGSQDRGDNPVRTLNIGTFFIDKYEVTQADYEKVMGNNPSQFKGCPTCPVEQVNWHDADGYCKKVGKRLPTEWEWEKAAKGGTTTAYYWGDAPDNAYVWWGENSGGKTHPVGKKKPNSYGLYDMSGNAWEWTASDFDDIGLYKVFRGGSWLSLPSETLSAGRFSFLSSSGYLSFGIRCVQ